MEVDREIVRKILEELCLEFQFEIFEFSKSRKTKHFNMLVFWDKFRKKYEESESKNYFSVNQAYKFLVPYQRVENDFQILIFGKLAPIECFVNYYEWQDWKKEFPKSQRKIKFFTKIKILNK